MIQSVNTVSSNTNCCGTKRKQSFGRTDSEYKQPSKAGRLAAYTATQLAAGAVVSGIFDGMTNLYRKVAKNKDLLKLKEMGVRAGFTGTCFAVIGLVFTAIGAMMAKKHKD